jgi:hypothetical protein
LVWLGRTAVFVGGLMLLGAIYESMAEASDARVYPPPGKLVDNRAMYARLLARPEGPDARITGIL